MKARPPVDLSIVTTAHDVADARLHRLVAVLVRAGLTVEVVGLGQVQSGPEGTSVRVLPRTSLPQRALLSAVAPWRTHGRVLMVLDPDLVLPALVRKVLGRWARSRGASARWVIADVHEDYLLALRDRRWARGPDGVLASGVARLARLAARATDLTVVADDHVPPYRARHRLVLPNAPLIEMLPEPSEREDRPRAIYVGDVRSSRGLSTMLEAMEMCPDWTLDVVGPVAADDRDWLAAWRRTSPARGRVRFHGRRPPREAWELARGAWAGLSLLTATPAFAAAMPTKLLEYLSCGLAVLSSPLPRPAALLSSTGAGVVAESSRQAAAVLQGWSQSPATIDVHRAASRAWVAGRPAQVEEYDRFVRTVQQLVRG